ncbi:MAG: 23S rRNA (pseudouridine(1915)-N(3))-methyltransferase RlmH [Rhodovibrionaceae bacterium]
MRVTIAAVGRVKSGPDRDLYEDYAKRLARGGLLGPLELKEVEARGKLSPEELKAREGALLLAAVPPGAAIVALDERGLELDSAGFAARLGAWRDQGRRDVAFLIGGAGGLGKEPRQAADLILRFGRLTWPHRLVRPLLAEQLYRAETILSGHPYHRE